MFFKISILVLFLATINAEEGKKSYDGWVLIKAHATNENQVDFLNSLRENEARGELQIWQQGNLKRPFDLFISPEYKEAVLAKLEEEGIKYEMRSENVQRAIDAEKVPVSSHTRSMAGVRNANWFTKFLKLEEINDAIDTLVSQNPDIVSVQNIGKGHEGRPIRLVTVTSNKNKNKPAIWVDGGIHAREWASPATVLYMLNKLVSGYKTNLTNYIDSATWYFVVVLNPDGYSHTHSTDRMWRKNRRPGSRGCEGVDLNRNFDYSFGGMGTSTDPCDDTYRGRAAFSEPESQAVRDFVNSHKDIKAFLTIHAYSQMWFYPFGDARNHCSPDCERVKRVAEAGAKALYSRYRTRYDVGTAADLLYEAAGGSDDWAKGKANIDYVYCLELRPSGNSAGNGFLLPPSKIVETGEETWEGIKVVADAAMGKQF